MHASFGASPVGPQPQATTGVIEGTVVDATGGVLPGVTVTLRNTATNYEQVSVTDSGGRFRGVLLPLGPYEVKVHLEGFAPQTLRGIDLGVRQTRTLEVKLSQLQRRGARRRRGRARVRAVRARFHVRRPAHSGPALLLHRVRRSGSRVDQQTDPSRIEQRVVDVLAVLGSPDENGPITRSHDARVILAKADWNASQRHLVTGRYNSHGRSNTAFDFARGYRFGSSSRSRTTTRASRSTTTSRICAARTRSRSLRSSIA